MAICFAQRGQLLQIASIRSLEAGLKHALAMDLVQKQRASVTEHICVEAQQNG